MERERREGGAYNVAVSGMKGIIRILLIVCLIIALIFIGREAYKLGYAVFKQEPVDAGEGREIKVTITEDMSVSDIGEMLKNAGLLEEEPLVFRIQERISDYHGELLPGTYTLRTGMTADEMLREIAGANEEDEEEENGTQQGTGSETGTAGAGR